MIGSHSIFAVRYFEAYDRTESNWSVFAVNAYTSLPRISCVPRLLGRPNLPILSHSLTNELFGGGRRRCLLIDAEEIELDCVTLTRRHHAFRFDHVQHSFVY